MNGTSLRPSTLGGFSSTRLSIAGLAVIILAPAVAGVVGYEADWSEGTTAFVALAPMWAVIGVQVLSINRVLGAWVGFFALFTLPQVGHFGEHVAQMAQIHWLNAAPPTAHGAVGALDIEWVHFIWNGWVLMGVGMLLFHFRRNPWLWASLPIAVWHLAEHLAIMVDFWDTGKAGDPGLLAMGGALGGGTGLIRPDLHFVYNVLMTAPLFIALVYQLRKCREEKGEPA
jgi:hypothetical protein